MRSPRLRWLGALAAVPLLLSGCDTALTAGGGVTNVGVETTLHPDGSWIVVQQGKVATTVAPRPVATATATPKPTFSPTPQDTSCAFNWLAGQVLIPVKAQVGPGSVTVSWPRVGEPPPDEYRVAAVPQVNVYGHQPELTWKSVTATSGCSASTEINGLESGKPYVVWLDAPDSGHQIDGTPRPRSGRSALVYPR